VQVFHQVLLLQHFMPRLFPLLDGLLPR
ncbi:hypothetical protein A2U01_0108963, partial [Trifolium medium]|nr:hypothetical protein [Trifolium medium]